MWERIDFFGRTADGAESERPFECLRCGAYLDLVYHTCPNCGSFSIDRRVASL
jgi:predicted RNA-binding Zn-ribbon protein involved in translation (DUF1610 family)